MDTALQEIATIAHEVSRIIRSPYTPSLQPLHDILKRSHPTNITAWLDSNACRIHALAEIILDSIRFHPSSLTLLLILLPAHEDFRRACQSLSPALLANCLEVVQTPGEHQQQYHNLCIQLLAKPLEGPLPAQVPSFLNRFVKRFTTEPTNDILSQVLDLLRGGNITVWPLDCLEGIQDTTIRVLREGHEDEGTSLRCLAVLAALAEDAQSGDCPSQSREFFTGKKANKSMVLGLTSAIKSLSAHLDGRRTASETAKHLRLAGRVFQLLEDKVMLVLDRTICLFTRKLCEKLQKDELCTEVRVAGARSVAVLLEDKTPQPIIDLIEKLMLNPNSSMSMTTSLSLLEPFIPKFGDTFAAELLTMGLNICERKAGQQVHDGQSYLHGLAKLFRSLLQFLPKSARVRDSVRKAFASPPVQQRLRALVQSADGQRSVVETDSTGPCDAETGFCARCLTDQRDVILLTTFKLFLSACPDADLQLGAQIAERLGRRQSGKNHAYQRLKQSSPSELCISDDHLQNLPAVDSTRWQHTLRQLMQEHASSQAAQLDQYFRATCVDLERRCNEVEKPLRDKEAIIAAQTGTIDDMKAALDRAQKDFQTVKQQAESEHHEKIQIQQQLNDMEVANDKALHESKRELAAVNSELEKERSSRLDQERVANTRIQDLQAELRDQSKQFSTAQAGLQDATNRLSEMQVKYDGVVGQYEALETEMGEMKRREASLSKNTQDLQHALEELTSAKDEASRALDARAAELKDLRLQMDELTMTTEQLARDKQTLEDQSAEARNKAAKLERDIVAQSDRLVATKEQELSDQSIFYDQALDQLREEVRTAQENATATARHHQDVVKELKHEIKTLRQEKERRAKELAQAQSLGRQLMGLMQQPTEGNNTVSPLKRRPDEISTDTLSSMLNDTQVSEIPDSFTSLKPSPVKRRTGRRALSELPPQSPRKPGSHDRRISWAPQHKKRASTFQSSLQDENMFEQSLDE